MEVIKEMEEKAVTEDIKSFDELMRHVAELPEQQREKVAYYAQGVIAASNMPRKAAVNE